MHRSRLLVACGDKDPAEAPPVDADSDGWALAEDCDDGEASIHPGAHEICDAVDNDGAGAPELLVGAWKVDQGGAYQLGAAYLIAGSDVGL